MKYILPFLACLLAGCQTGDRGTYPYRPITLVVPWSAGGGTDTGARALAAVLPDILGQPVTVVNRTGGGGVVGHLAVAQATPDGYTIGAVTGDITMMHWVGLTDLTPADFAPIALLMINPSAISVRADAPWDSLEELLESLRTEPGAYLASGTSRGGIWDLARIGFLEFAGLPESALPWVPSQGAAPALQELLSGGVSVVTVALAETDALRRAGRVKVLAVMADERLAVAPEVPTLKELGIDWSIGGWVTVGAPKNTPEPVLETLRSAVRTAMQDSAFRTPLQNAAFNLQHLYGEQLATFIEEQDQINGELLTLAGLTRDGHQ